VNPGQYEFYLHFYLLGDESGIGNNNENLNYNIMIQQLHNK